MADGEKKKYTVPCNRCGKEIKFVRVKKYDGTFFNMPCEVEDDYITTMTSEKTEKGQFIWKSTKIAVPHGKNCTGEGAPAGEDAEKPPF